MDDYVKFHFLKIHVCFRFSHHTTASSETAYRFPLQSIHIKRQQEMDCGSASLCYVKSCGWLHSLCPLGISSSDTAQLNDNGIWTPVNTRASSCDSPLLGASRNPARRQTESACHTDLLPFLQQSNANISFLGTSSTCVCVCVCVCTIIIEKPWRLIRTQMRPD